MTADKDLIAHLNTVLKAKLTGINQYFLHARMLKYQGNVALADFEYKASIDAMKHSDMLVEHVLSQGGIPNLQELGSLAIGETQDDMLHNDLGHSEAVAREIKAAIAFCESRKHTASAQLLGKILESHEERTDFIQKQLKNSNLATTNIKECA